MRRGKPDGDACSARLQYRYHLQTDVVGGCLVNTLVRAAHTYPLIALASLALDCVSGIGGPWSTSGKVNIKRQMYAYLLYREHETKHASSKYPRNSIAKVHLNEKRDMFRSTSRRSQRRN